MITAVLNITIPLFALGSLIAVVYFFGRAFSSRIKASKEKYSVGEFERYRDMKLDIMRGVGAAIVGLILLSIYGVMPHSIEAAKTDEAVATVIPAATDNLNPSPTVTAIIVPTMGSGTAVSIPTTTPSVTATAITLTDETPAAATSAPITPIVTETPLAAPTDTANTAVVSSGVGVWLRDAPTTNSEQLEWLLEGAVLTLLDGQQTADGFDWQEVRTIAGVDGWVAAEFIQIGGE